MKQADLDMMWNRYRNIGAVIPLAKLHWHTEIDDKGTIVDGNAISYHTHFPNREFGLTMFDIHPIVDAESSLFLVDGGNVVTPMVVVGYPEKAPWEGRYVHLRQLPTGGTSTPYEHYDFRLPPRKAYHVKVYPVEIPPLTINLRSTIPTITESVLFGEPTKP